MLLRTLGGLQLEGTEFQRPKPLLLLAYLALEGPQERGYLAELFFQGSSNGRHKLIDDALAPSEFGTRRCGGR